MGNVTSKTDKKKAGYVEGTASLVVNSILFALKLWVGILTGSIALTADAWHTASDAVSSIVVIFAAKISARKATQKHPFGYGRWDQIASLFIAFFLGVVGFDSLKSAITQLSHRGHVTYGILAIVITAFSVIAKVGMAWYAFRLGKKSGNLTVRADGWHNLSDAASSFVVLIGILVASRFWWMDGALGIIVALMLFQAAFAIAKETISILLGDEPDPKVVDQIREESKTLIGYDVQPHNFRLHDYSTEKELVFHIRLDPNMSLGTAHQIASRVEDMIESKFEMYTTVHVEVVKDS